MIGPFRTGGTAGSTSRKAVLAFLTSKSSAKPVLPDEVNPLARLSVMFELFVPSAGGFPAIRSPSRVLLLVVPPWNKARIEALSVTKLAPSNDPVVPLPS